MVKIYVFLKLFLFVIRDNNMQSGITKLDVQTVAQFDDHNCTVWRICWNVTGTVLASSGDDGCVRMFKSKYMLCRLFPVNFFLNL